ncbi:MAG: DUF58 domain-containing protein [Anaerolineae bacterium]
MFTEAWLDFAALMLVFAALFQQPSLLLLACLLLTVVPAGWVWQRVAFWRVTYERRLSETRVLEGESVVLTVRLANRKWLPLAWIKVSDRMPLALTPQEKALAPSHLPQVGMLDFQASLWGHEGARWEYHIPCNRRGFYALGPAEIGTGDLFGLFERKVEHPRIDQLIVYPRIDPIADWGLPPQAPFGEAKSRTAAFADATRVRGLRDYRPDDPPKHIHWRATAHRNTLQVKVYDPTVEFNWVIFLDVQTYPQSWQGIDSARAEHAIRLAASLSSYAADHKYTFGLVANGTYPDSDQRLRVLPGRSPNQLRNVLEALAAVSYMVTAPIDTLLRRESMNLPWGATLIVVTPLVTENLLAGMADLAEAGRRLALVSLDPNWKQVDLGRIVVYQAQAPVTD